MYNLIAIKPNSGWAYFTDNDGKLHLVTPPYTPLFITLLSSDNENSIHRDIISNSTEFELEFDELNVLLDKLRELNNNNKKELVFSDYNKNAELLKHYSEDEVISLLNDINENYIAKGSFKQSVRLLHDIMKYAEVSKTTSEKLLETHNFCIKQEFTWYFPESISDFNSYSRSYWEEYLLVYLSELTYFSCLYKKLLNDFSMLFNEVNNNSKENISIVASKLLLNYLNSDSFSEFTLQVRLLLDINKITFENEYSGEIVNCLTVSRYQEINFINKGLYADLVDISKRFIHFETSELKKVIIQRFYHLLNLDIHEKEVYSKVTLLVHHINPNQAYSYVLSLYKNKSKEVFIEVVSDLIQEIKKNSFQSFYYWLDLKSKDLKTIDKMYFKLFKKHIVELIDPLPQDIQEDPYLPLVIGELSLGNYPLHALQVYNICKSYAHIGVEEDINKPSEMLQKYRQTISETNKNWYSKEQYNIGPIERPFVFLQMPTEEIWIESKFNTKFFCHEILKSSKQNVRIKDDDASIEDRKVFEFLEKEEFCIE